MQHEKTYTVSPEQLTGLVSKALYWADNNKDYYAYFTSCDISYPYGAFPHMLAIGEAALPFDPGNPFESINDYRQQHPEWLIGYYSYELKNNIHGLGSNNTNSLNLPLSNFFKPDHMLFFDKNSLVIKSKADPDTLYRAIQNQAVPDLVPCLPAKLTSRLSRSEYLHSVKQIKNHILEGDCYELNLCFELLTENYYEDPIKLFRQLSSLSPAPFTTFQRYNNQYLICASPERFLKKEGDLLISQPIKGTIRRGLTPQEDAQFRNQLANSEKERAENMMIVDLVRNDLAQSCQWGSVAVPEIFGIYSFRQVHQMISTITGLLKPEVTFTEAIKNAFPMGSMTGAPKKIVMELIDRYETRQRGLYSGAAGFITPAGNFDFNVVIRSLIYDKEQQKLSFSVGGAITWDSDPEQEYEECLLKAKAILQLLSATFPE